MINTNFTISYTCTYFSCDILIRTSPVTYLYVYCLVDASSLVIYLYVYCLVDASSLVIYLYVYSLVDTSSPVIYLYVYSLVDTNARKTKKHTSPRDVAGAAERNQISEVTAKQHEVC